MSDLPRTVFPYHPGLAPHGLQWHANMADTDRNWFALWHQQRLPLTLLLLWCGYLLTNAFYFFPAGYPQPANVLLLSGILIWVMRNTIHPQQARIETYHFNRGNMEQIYLQGLPFIGLTVIINFAHYIYLPDRLFLLHMAYYPYNFLVFCFVITLFRMAPEHTNQSARWMLMAATVIQVIWSFLDPNTLQGRSAGTLDSYNQLAHWGLLVGVCLLALKRGRAYTLADLFCFALLGYIQILALSKAGIISYAVLMLIALFSPSVTRMQRIFVIFTVACVFLAMTPRLVVITDELMNVQAVSNVVDRLGNIGMEADDSAEARGYTRFMDYPEYLLLGAGEGPFWRFNANQEIHSGLMTVLFSYGIFGLGLFLYFLYGVVRGMPLYYSFLLLPPFLYSLTHQNMRFTLLWVTLAVIYAGRYFLEDRRDNLNRTQHE